MIEEESIREAANLILRAAPNSRVIVFGSHARGTARPDSDVDFLVIEPEVMDQVAEMVRLGEVVRPLMIPADIIVLSEKRYNYWRDTPNTLPYLAAKEGKVYEPVA